MSFMLVACGTERPDPSNLRTQKETADSTKKTAQTAAPQTADSTKKDATNSVAETKPAETPEAPKPADPVVAKAPIRTLANAAEIAAAQTSYATLCAGCHGALAVSVKKGRTAAAITNARIIVPHQPLATALTYPLDVADAEDDGIDKAVLKASAMAEALK